MYIQNVCSLEAIISTEQLTCRKFKHNLPSFIFLKSKKVPGKKNGINLQKKCKKIKQSIHINFLNFRQRVFS